MSLFSGRRGPKALFLAVVCIVAGLAGAKESAGGRQGLFMQVFFSHGLDCDGAQCQTMWGECLRPVVDHEGVANVDTMEAVPCRRAAAAGA